MVIQIPPSSYSRQGWTSLKVCFWHFLVLFLITIILPSFTCCFPPSGSANCFSLSINWGCRSCVIDPQSMISLFLQTTKIWTSKKSFLIFSSINTLPLFMALDLSYLNFFFFFSSYLILIELVRVLIGGQYVPFPGYIILFTRGHLEP